MEVKNYVDVNGARNRDKQSTVIPQYQLRIKCHNLNWIISRRIKMRRKNTAQRGIIIRSITGRTAMSSYLSSPNDSRNNCDLRYHETFSLLFPLCRHVNPRRARNRRALRHIFYRSTHSGRYRAYCLLNRDLYAFAIFPSRDWTRQGVAGKIQVLGLRDWTIRTGTRANDICRNVPRGANFIPRATWSVIADITFPAYFSL